MLTLSLLIVVRPPPASDGMQDDSNQKQGPRSPEVGVLLVVDDVAGVRHVVVLAEAAGQRPQQVERQRSWAGLRLPAQRAKVESRHVA